MKPGWDLMIEVARDLKPERVVCIGDLADFWSVSAHSKSPERAALLKDEVEVVRDLRSQLDGLGAKEKIFCAGNHEHRLTRYLMDKAPALFGTVSVPSVLGLDDWHYVEYRDHVRRGAMHFTHDTGHAGRHAVYRALDTYQHSNVTGHTHRCAYVIEGNAVGEMKVSVQFGWLGDTDQIDYMHRAMAKKNWATAFGIGWEDKNTGHTWWYPVPIVDDRVVIPQEPKLYKARAKRRGRRS